MSTAFPGLSHTDANTAWLGFAGLEVLYIMQIPSYKANQGMGTYLVGKEGNAALIKSGVLQGWTYRKLAVQTVFNYFVAIQGPGVSAGTQAGVPIGPGPSLSAPIATISRRVPCRPRLTPADIHLALTVRVR